MIIKPLEYNNLSFINTIRNECKDMLHNNSSFTLSETEKWFTESKPQFYVIHLDDGIPIGYFRTSNLTKDSLYIGVDLHKDYRGKGLAFEAYEQFIPFILSKHKVEMLKLEVLSHNPKAIRLYEKLGFVIESIQKSYTVRNDEIIDNITMVYKLNTFE
jgi:RimJ/RimL family protein N-acetyltransferase